MARLPPIKSLQIEDFQDQKSWIGKLLIPLNQFMTTIYNTLNGSLEFGSNIRGQIHTINFIEGTTELPLRFRSTFGRPQGVLIVNLVDVSDAPATITDAPYADWSFSGDQFVIRNILGLQSGKKYRITLLCI